MKTTRAIVAILLVTFLVSISGAAVAEELTGREIMEKNEKLNKGEDEFNETSMRLVNKRGQERNRKIEYYSKTDKDDNDKILIRFVEPADVKGVGLLTIEHSDRDDDQWLYLPALKKVRRISSSDQGDSFMGTDYTYEDIRSEKLDEHNYKLIGSEVVDGQDCYVVEALPATEKQKNESGYSKRILWVKKDIFLIVQVKYFDKKGEHFKTEIHKDFVEAAPKLYRPNFMKMENLKTGHSTTITFDERKMNSGLSDNLFTERMLKRG
jgi:outer membrane lipoprotein-sorting protein